MKLKYLLISIAFINSVNVYACSKMTNNFGHQGVFTARTMDLCVDLPYDIAIYPRGMKENGGVSSGKSLAWDSKYASIMVRELSDSTKADVDGVNEKGLAVNLLYLDGTKYETRNLDKPGVLMVKWAKYVLDNYQNVNEVIKNLNSYQIVNEAIKIGGKNIDFPIHFSIEDTKGDNAVIELINGKVVVYHGSKYNILTNEPSYDKQLSNLSEIQKTTNYSAANLPGGANSMNRFVRSYYFSHNMPQKPLDKSSAVSNMYSAISGVFTPYGEDYKKNCSLAGGSGEVADVWPTQWATVTDQSNKVLYILDGKTGNQISVKLGNFNTNVGQPVRTINLQKVNFNIDATDMFKSNS